ncbi:MAG: hypothetical protein K0Q49_2259 [Haloplasmataceae bacterium]|jgi:hypothetical protein|nr:hypothetical protein [Haloplasmataceae bacterium]
MKDKYYKEVTMNKLNSKTIIFGILGVVVLLIAFIFFLPEQSKAEKAFLEKYELNDQSVEQIVAKLEHSTNEDPSLYAAIKSSKLILGDDDNEFSLNVPNDKFYLSLAPYINTTHPCGNHNLITCRGELKNQTMNILIKDSRGKVIIDDDYTSYSNGFIGVWLPKNISGTITVTYNGLSATTDISTNSNSNTCLTTMKLS